MGHTPKRPSRHESDEPQVAGNRKRTRTADILFLSFGIALGRGRRTRRRARFLLLTLDPVAACARGAPSYLSREPPPHRGHR